MEGAIFGGEPFHGFEGTPENELMQKKNIIHSYIAKFMFHLHNIEHLTIHIPQVPMIVDICRGTIISRIRRVHAEMYLSSLFPDNQ